MEMAPRHLLLRNPPLHRAWHRREIGRGKAGFLCCRDRYRSSSPSLRRAPALSPSSRSKFERVTRMEIAEHQADNITIVEIKGRSDSNSAKTFGEKLTSRGRPGASHRGPQEHCLYQQRRLPGTPGGGALC